MQQFNVAAAVATASFCPHARGPAVYPAILRGRTRNSSGRPLQIKTHVATIVALEHVRRNVELD